MTEQQLRQLVTGDTKHFTLPTQTLKERLGEPAEIKILKNLAGHAQHQVVLMLFRTDRGRVEVFCPIGFVNGEETIIDGWVGAELLDEDHQPPNVSSHRLRGIDHLKGLFD